MNSAYFPLIPTLLAAACYNNIREKNNWKNIQVKYSGWLFDMEIKPAAKRFSCQREKVTLLKRVTSTYIPTPFPLLGARREKTLTSAGHVIPHNYFVNYNLCNRSQILYSYWRLEFPQKYKKSLI